MKPRRDHSLAQAIRFAIGFLTRLTASGWRAWSLLAISLASLLVSVAAHSATYANAATTFSWINATTHTKVTKNSAPYAFKNLGGCGTSPPIIDDTISDRIPLGFNFTFGDKTFDSLRIDTNGRIQFTSTSIPWDNTTCGYGSPVTQLPYPNATLTYTIRIYGNDLDPTPSVDALPNGYVTACNDGTSPNNNPCFVSFATVGSAPDRKFVVTWQGVPEWASFTSAIGSYNVQLILQENGEFIYQYGTDVPGPAAATAQVGWEISFTDYDVSKVGYPVPNTAIRYFVPHPVVEYLMEQNSWGNGDKTITDTSGNGASGSRIGTAGQLKPQSGGKVCKGASYSGAAGAAIDSGLSVPTVIGNTGTIAFWYKSANSWNLAATPDEQLLDATTTNGQWFYLSRRGASASGSKLHFAITDSVGAVHTVETAAISVAAGTWKHIAITWSFNNYTGGNNDELNIYVDGVLSKQTLFTSTTLTLSPTIGSLYIGGTRAGLAESGGGTTNSANGMIDEFRAYNYKATQSTIASIMTLNTGGCLDHYSITDSGTGLSCQLSTVTLASHTSAETAYTNNNLVTLTTATGKGSWILLTGHGSLTNVGTNTGQATYLFNGESQVLLGLSYPTTDTVTFNATDGNVNLFENTPLAVTDCVPGMFNACELSASRCTPAAGSTAYANLYTKLANTAFNLDAVATNSSGTLYNTFNGTVTVKLLANTTYPTINPSSNCPTSQVDTITVGAIKFVAGRAEGTAGTTHGIAVAANAFSSGAQQYSAYGDVRVQFICPTPTCSPAQTVCATDAFTVRPTSFTISSSAAGDVTNGTNASAASPVKAGATFTITANSNTKGYNGTPNLDPTAAQWPGAPSGGIASPGAGTPSGSFAAATIGTGNGAAGNFTYSDVGYFRLAADGIYDSSFAGLSQDSVKGDCVPNSSSNTADGTGRFGCNVANIVPTPYIGRFIPDHFSMTAASFAGGCPAGGFSYMDQPFSTPLSASIEARNTADQKTVNYSGASFGKAVVTPQLENNNNGTLIPIARLTASGTPSWSGGAYPFSYTRFNRSGLDGPYDSLQLGFSLSDADGVALTGLNMNAATSNDCVATSSCTAAKAGGPIMARLGRLRLSNTFGSVSPLAMPVEAQYWSGLTWVKNTDDSCTTTTGATPQVSFPAIAGWTLTPNAFTSGAMSGGLKIEKSSSGTTTIAATVPAWLKPDPSALATIGIYGTKESRKAVHIRELY